MVLVDGVQVNDASGVGGGFNFNTLDPNGIDRIEVLKGPQAVLYGSDAIGGVINIITKTGQEGFQGNAFAEYGSFASLRTGANLNGASGMVGFNLSGAYTVTTGISSADKADGNSEKDGYNSLSLRGKVTATLSDAIRLEALATYADSDSDYDGFALQGDGSYGLGDTDDSNNAKELSVAGRGYVDLWDGLLSNTLSVEYSEIDRRSYSGGVLSYRAKGERFNLDYLGVFKLSDDMTFTGGAQHEEVKSVEQDPDPISTDSVFASLAYDGFEGLTLSGGLRYDHHQTFGGATNAEVSASYLIAATGTRLVANWGQGFKAPTIFQLTFACCGFEADPTLRPERANAWEAGVRQSFLNNKVSFAATYFDQHTEDLIIFTYTAGYQNVSRARAKGLELSLTADLSESLSLDANYTYTSSKDRDANTDLARRPKNKAYAALNWAATDKLNTILSVTHNGRELDSGTSYLDAWTRVDARVSYQINSRVELYGRVDNLFDADYQQVKGYGTPGMSVYAGVRTRF